VRSHPAKFVRVAPAALSAAGPYLPLLLPIGGSDHDEASTRVHAIHPSGLPRPITPGWNRSPWALNLGLRTSRLPATHAEAGTVLAHWTENYTIDISRSSFDEFYCSHATSMSHDLVDPRGTLGSEMKPHLRVDVQPGHHLRRGVCRQVVQHDMDIPAPVRSHRFLEERQKIRAVTGRCALAQNLTGAHVQRGEQVRDAVPNVPVRAGQRPVICDTDNRITPGNPTRGRASSAQTPSSGAENCDHTATTSTRNNTSGLTDEGEPAGHDRRDDRI